MLNFGPKLYWIEIRETESIGPEWYMITPRLIEENKHEIKESETILNCTSDKNLQNSGISFELVTR